ncbi:hypothetical protein BCF11_3591 [Collimonas sp. PA-H2]|uniref:hypothetical protein n=1 Tax=Collimonas sp. PA-H2 TaxID=1881062 RepID=UPI000BF90201|nr:hypothetical protein [Collimonas sp. PA-H2]PFH11149.1 hypothetical protein BCF11_3591 [Collimonas sp. PA-H2]
MADVLRYGDKVHLLNGYANWDGGYLDSYGHADLPGAKYGVLTSVSPNRGEGTGTWRIDSAEGKAAGSEVLSCDSIYLFNLYLGDGGYLGTYGHAATPEQYGVVTANKADRPDDVLTWRVFADSTDSYDGKIRVGDVVHFLNDYNRTHGGFLDTCNNAGKPDTKYGVFTSRLLNRGLSSGPTAATGAWKFSKA